MTAVSTLRAAARTTDPRPPQACCRPRRRDAARRLELDVADLAGTTATTEMLEEQSIQVLRRSLGNPVAHALQNLEPVRPAHPLAVASAAWRPRAMSCVDHTYNVAGDLAHVPTASADMARYS